MNIFLASKWIQHPCCPALTRNQQFKLPRPEINVLELTPCEINVFAVAHSREINILMVFPEINIFLRLHIAKDQYFAGF